MENHDSEHLIPLLSHDEERTILGPYDEHARLLRETYGVQVVSRNGTLRLIGDAAALAEVHRRMRDLLGELRHGRELTPDEVRERLKSEWQAVSEPETEATEAGREGAGEEARAVPAAEAGRVPAGGRRAGGEVIGGGSPAQFGIRIVLPSGILEPKTRGQAQYMEHIRNHAVTFAIGPAGTGKTFLAVAMAVEALRRGDFRRLVLVRPAVEAGEKLGFLPGDFQAKVNPYLRPLYDALNDLIDPQATQRYFENDVLEVVPLAFMRGRTLNSSFIILDEAQNTTARQMMMFLTRMGYGSKIVVTGDVTQIDLPRGTTSGLVDVRQRLKGIDGVAFSILDRSDIVRHPLVQRIVDAYGESGMNENPDE